MKLCSYLKIINSLGVNKQNCDDLSLRKRLAATSRITLQERKAIVTYCRRTTQKT